MKKLYLCILALFLFSTMLLAVESEPSEIVGYVAYECVTGTTGNLNFIALPMDTGYETSEDLGNAYPGQIDAISKWIPETQSWEADSYDGTQWLFPFDLDPGNAYMINIVEPITFYSVGSIVPPIQYNLVTGTTGNLNFIMVPLDRSDLDESGDLGDDIGVVDAVSKWVADTQSWEADSYDGTQWLFPFAIEIAKPLMVNITEPVTWPEEESRLHSRN